MALYHIGIDSTDSAEEGMCTTYLGARLLEELDRELGLKEKAYPEIVRLNPNVPWKTRGNGAVCLRYEGESGLIDHLEEVCSSLIEDLSVLTDPQTNPGLAILPGDVPGSVKDFSRRALHSILELREAEELAEDHRLLLKGWKNGRGKIGALAAVGADLSKFHTYEGILYRPVKEKARERDVDVESLREASKAFTSTFFNVDGAGKPVCIPHSPCPVILGIRGVDPIDIMNALRTMRVWNAERWVLWRTNQHTDAHIEAVQDLSSILPYSSITTEGEVHIPPAYSSGGHLSFGLRDGAGRSLECWAYEPTKGFRKALAGLVPGDHIRVWGSVRAPSSDHGPSLNLEKVEVLHLAKEFEMKNPRCPACGGPTESMGRGQGLRCKKCGNREDGMRPVQLQVIRHLRKGPIEPPMCAWRHLYRPVDMPRVEKERVWPGPFWGRGLPGQLA